MKKSEVICAACNQPIKEEERCRLRYTCGNEVIEFHEPCRKGVILIFPDPHKENVFTWKGLLNIKI